MRLTLATEGSVPLCKAQAKTNTAFGKICKKTFAGRFLGIALGIAIESLNIVKQITNIGENAFKGLANIFSASCNKEAKVSRGITQLGIAACATFVIILSLPFALFGCACIAIALLVKGEKYAKQQAYTYTQESYDNQLTIEEREGFKVLEDDELNALKEVFKIQNEIAKADYTRDYYNSDSMERRPFNEDFFVKITEEYSEEKFTLTLRFINIFNDCYLKYQKNPKLSFTSYLAKEQQIIQKELIEKQDARRREKRGNAKFNMHEYLGYNLNLQT